MNEHLLHYSHRSPDAGNGVRAPARARAEVVSVPADASDPLTATLAEKVANFEVRRSVALQIRDSDARRSVLYWLRQALCQEVKDLLGV